MQDSYLSPLHLESLKIQFLFDSLHAVEHVFPAVALHDEVAAVLTQAAASMGTSRSAVGAVVQIGPEKPRATSLGSRPL